VIDQFLAIVGFLVICVIGVFCIRTIYRSYKLYKVKYILYFLIFILFDIIQSFVAFTWGYFFELSLNINVEVNLIWLFMFFTMFNYVLTFLSLYILIYIIFHLLEVKIPKILLYIYIIWGVFSVGFFIFSYVLTLTTSIVAFTLDTMISMLMVDRVCKLTLILFFLIITWRKKKSRLKRAFSYFGLYFLIVYLANLPYVYFRLNTWGFPMLINSLFVYLIPLLFIKKFLIKLHGSSTLIKMYKTKQNKFITRYQISKREKEIIYMILQGKSNKEIENELFISQNTVKNHIYNIFQKVGVNSRAQLTKYFIADIEKI